MMFSWVPLSGCFFPTSPTTSTILHLLPLIRTCRSPLVYISWNLEATVVLLRYRVSRIMFLTWREEGIMTLRVNYQVLCGETLSPSLSMRLVGDDCFYVLA